VLEGYHGGDLGHGDTHRDKRPGRAPQKQCQDEQRRVQDVVSIQHQDNGQEQRGCRYGIAQPRAPGSPELRDAYDQKNDDGEIDE
jgi:hypothetical protein